MKFLRHYSYIVLISSLVLLACGEEESENTSGNELVPDCKADCSDSEEDHMDHMDHMSCMSASQIGDDNLKGMQHGVHFEMIEFNPSTLVTGLNTLKIKVTDEQDQPMDIAAFVLTPFMSQHNHGTSPATFEGMMDMNGVYEFTDVNFLMQGLWDLNFTFNAHDMDMQLTLKVCVDP